MLLQSSRLIGVVFFLLLELISFRTASASCWTADIVLRVLVDTAMATFLSFRFFRLLVCN